MLKKIWITRAKDEQENAKKIVKKYGFEPISIPLIEFSSIFYKVPKENYEGIVFSSKTGVRFFFKDKALVEKLKNVKLIFSVGKETKKLLENYLEKENIKIDIAPLPKKFKGEDLAQVILEKNIKTLLLPGPKERRNILFEILKKHNIRFCRLDIYETKIKKLSEEEKEKVLNCQAVTLTSPSTFKGILKNNLLNPLLKKNTMFLVIGDVTENFVKNYVPQNLILKPEIFTFEEMIKTYKSFLEKSVNF